MFPEMRLCGCISVGLLMLVVLTHGRPSNTPYTSREHALRQRLLQHQIRQAYHGLLLRRQPPQQHHHNYLSTYHSPRNGVSSKSRLSTGTTHGRSRSRRGHNSLPGSRMTVVWGARCSPRKAWVRPNSDVSLECEVLVPAGSVLLWKKDGLPVHSLREFPGDVVDNSIHQSRYMDQSVGTVHMSSRVYIDCASEADEGNYTLEVQTPNGQQSIRIFTVKLAEYIGDPIGMFCHDLAIVPYIPRIYEYARAHMATIGQDIVLPCQIQGNNHTVTWHFQNMPLPRSSSSFQIHANGDLLIRELSLDHRGVFACQTMSTIVPELSDIAFTTLYPVVPQEEQTNEINQSVENANT